MIAKEGRKITPFAYWLIHSRKGEVLFTQKADKDVTAHANFYTVKVRTKRMQIIEGNQLKEIVKITKL